VEITNPVFELPRNYEPIGDITLYHQFLTALTKTCSQAAFHLITVYKKAYRPADATVALKYSATRLFNTIIGANWRRKNILRAFKMFAFLDDPGSRHRSTNVSVPIASAQDTYHHHSILIVDDWIGGRIKDRFCYSDDHTHTVDPEWSELRQRIAKQVSNAEQLSLSPHSFARRHLSATGVRSCMIQHLPTTDDLERAAMYASKSATRLSQLFPDDYLLIFPHGSAS
jgi:hypothetical protein